MPNSRQQNYYDLLGVAQTASDDQLRQAYRTLAKEYHPDRNGGDDTRFVAIGNAYDVLRDPRQRAAYDLDLAERNRAAAAARHDATTTADFGGAAASATEKAAWEGGSTRVKPSPSPRAVYRAPAAPFWPRIRRNKYVVWAVGALIVYAVFIIATHFLNFGQASVPTFTPLVSSGPQTSGVPVVVPSSDSPTPTSTPTPTPTPSATPSCPTGVPQITTTSITPSQNGNGFERNNQQYTITGQVTNPSTVSIMISSVGFYLGSYDPTSAPDWTSSFAAMTQQGSDIVAPGATVSWSTTQTLPTSTQNPPTAVVTYPQSDGATPTAQWSYQDIPSDCPTSN